jgi:hypothetical protein
MSVLVDPEGCTRQKSARSDRYHHHHAYTLAPNGHCVLDSLSPVINLSIPAISTLRTSVDVPALKSRSQTTKSLGLIVYSDEKDGSSRKQTIYMCSPQLKSTDNSQGTSS